MDLDYRIDHFDRSMIRVLWKCRRIGATPITRIGIDILVKDKSDEFELVKAPDCIV